MGELPLEPGDTLLIQEIKNQLKHYVQKVIYCLWNGQLRNTE